MQRCRHTARIIVYYVPFLVDDTITHLALRLPQIGLYHSVLRHLYRTTRSNTHTTLLRRHIAIDGIRTRLMKDVTCLLWRPQRMTITSVCTITHWLHTIGDRPQRITLGVVMIHLPVLPIIRVARASLVINNKMLTHLPLDIHRVDMTNRIRGYS